MRTLPTAKPSRIARPILFTLAIFAALTLLGVISRPTVHVAAQSAADSTQTPNVYRPKFNYTGDSKSDFVMIANPGPAGSAITWKVLRNPGIPGPNNAFIRIFSYGLNGDALNPADFNNDGISEVSVWRSGTSYSAPFPEGTAGFSNLNVINWGNPTGENLGRDGDYDGDGIIDLTTVRFGADRKLTWVYRGTAGTNRQVQFGLSAAGRSPFVLPGADWTGDGRDELIWCDVNTTNGLHTWWVGDSITGNIVFTGQFGDWNIDNFLPPDDYTGDGRADLVTVRIFADSVGNAFAGGWMIRDTATGTMLPVVKFGVPDPAFDGADFPLRGNYDGDNKADLAVWRPTNATFYWINSSNGTIGGQQWGAICTPPTACPETPEAIRFTF